VPAGKHWIRFTTNHDESAWDATPISLFNGVHGALAASVITIFTGGVPLIYAGQEVGVANTVPFFSNSTINWSANPDMLLEYQKILQLYSNSTVARRGVNTTYSNDQVVLFKKTLSGEDLLIVVNVRNNSTLVDVPAELQNTDWVDALTNEPVSLENQIPLGPYGYVILKK
jgi:glycosidase